jgi:uncharacterized membrane protein SpoIIM required for sporulation
LSFILGISFGIGSLYIVLSNALTLGAVFGLVVSSGYGKNIFIFVIAHSSFELIGLCLSAGAGLALGVSIIFAGEEKRSVIFVRKARELVPIILTSAIFIFSAAFIEGFVSPTKINILIKISIAFFSFIFIIIISFRIYFIKILKKIKRRVLKW